MGRRRGGPGKPANRGLLELIGTTCVASPTQSAAKRIKGAPCLLHDPPTSAELEVIADRGAAALVDAHPSLGLWAASEAMDLAVERATGDGIGMISVRAGTHSGWAGYHAASAVPHHMVGVVASDCGRRRIVRPPGGRVAMMGTNPLRVAGTAGGGHPFVSDMSTTVVPAGRVRQAARAGRPVPDGWLADDRGDPVTDPAAFDSGAAHLLWLGSSPETSVYKRFGLGLRVEVPRRIPIAGEHRGRYWSPICPSNAEIRLDRP